MGNVVTKKTVNDRSYTDLSPELELRNVANTTDPMAQLKLGVQYYFGEVVTKDLKEAVKWFRLAAEKGHAKAQYNLGYCYDFGYGVPQDKKEAVKWYQRAAEKGHANAQCNLGYCYKFGEGITQDLKEAVKWYQQAAEKGHADAQCNLGYCYKFGEGITQDLKEAVKWYQLAAEKGHAKAQFNLGNCYLHGYGVTTDLKEAVRWYQLAAEKGYADAQFNLGVLCEENGNRREAVKWYIQAAKQGYRQDIRGKNEANTLLKELVKLTLPQLPLESLDTFLNIVTTNEVIPIQKLKCLGNGLTFDKCDKLTCSGNYGEVWEVKLSNGGQAAVKYLKDITEEEEARDRFLKEMAIHRYLTLNLFANHIRVVNHPNVVKILALNVDSMELMMELMVFGTLKDVIKKSAEGDGLLDINEWRIKLCLDVAKGMEYLHSHTPTIIHRDLKSSNILVTQDKEGHPIAKIGDFGLSFIKDIVTSGPDMTHYIYTRPPEMTNPGFIYNTVCDVFSFSFIMWEMLTQLPLVNGFNASQNGKYKGLSGEMKSAASIFEELQKGKRPKVPDFCERKEYISLMTRCWSDQADQRPNSSDIVKDLQQLKEFNQSSLLSTDAYLEEPIPTEVNASCCIVMIQNSAGDILAVAQIPSLKTSFQDLRKYLLEQVEHIPTQYEFLRKGTEPISESTESTVTLEEGVTIDQDEYVVVINCKNT